MNLTEIIIKYRADVSGAMTGLEQVNRAIDKTNREVESKFGALAGRMNQIGASMTVAFTVPFALLAKSATEAYTEMDSLQRGLVAVTGSAAAAEAQMRKLREVAKLPGLGLKEAISGAIRLQAAGMDEQLTIDSMKAFGNALATVGGTKEQMEGVNLALGQIMAKGKVFAEEINQINERVPQIREAMRQAFGTSNTEELQKMGMTAEEFVRGITNELAKLPAVTGGIKNSIENTQDAIMQAKASIGEALAPAVGALAKAAEVAAKAIGLIPTPLKAVGLVIFGLVAAAGPLVLMAAQLMQCIALWRQLRVEMLAAGTASGTLGALGGVAGRFAPMVGKGGLIAGGALLAGSMVGGYVAGTANANKDSYLKYLGKQVLGGATAGAGWGYVGGSVVPVVGNLAGAILGGLGGTAMAIWKAPSKADYEVAQKQSAAAAKAQKNEQAKAKAEQDELIKNATSGLGIGSAMAPVSAAASSPTASDTGMDLYREAQEQERARQEEYMRRLQEQREFTLRVAKAERSAYMERWAASQSNGASDAIKQEISAKVDLWRELETLQEAYQAGEDVTQRTALAVERYNQAVSDADKKRAEERKKRQAEQVKSYYDAYLLREQLGGADGTLLALRRAQTEYAQSDRGEIAGLKMRVAEKEYTDARKQQEEQRTKTLYEQITERIRLFKQETSERIREHNRWVDELKRNSTGVTDAQGLNKRLTQTGLGLGFNNMYWAEPVDNGAITTEQILNAKRAIDQDEQTQKDILKQILDALRMMGGRLAYE